LVNLGSPLGFFPKPPVVDFAPELGCCQCGGHLKVYKSRSKPVVTMHLGEFISHERLMECSGCKKRYESEQLSSLVSKRCKFGYDVMVHVGKALFLRHCSQGQVIDELALRNICISASQIAYLGRKFIIYLSLAHYKRAHAIQDRMRRHRGGYILHLDGTCDGNGPVLMSGLDSISEIVLGNIKLPSEKAEEIIPFLEKIRNLFGIPIAIVHDMGRGILKAVASVFPGTPDYICHFHFLRDIGKDLFGVEYDLIRSRLKVHGIRAILRRRTRSLRKAIDSSPKAADMLKIGVSSDQLPALSKDMVAAIGCYSLLQWALRDVHNGYGFPFDCPHLGFAKRLFTVYQEITTIGNHHSDAVFLKLKKELQPIIDDINLKSAMATMKIKQDKFSELRQAMRIAPENSTKGLNDDGTDDNIGDIETRVRQFREKTSSEPTFSKNPDYVKLVAQIDKYWQKLFCDPIKVYTSDGGSIMQQPQRTNNLLERFFRDFKRGYRKKTGNNSMGKMLQTILADTPLVKNLQNPFYMKLLLNGKSTLEEVFAQIDAQEARNLMTNKEQSNERVPKPIQKMINQPAFPLTLRNILLSTN
jgi:hypothetical protein